VSAAPQLWARGAVTGIGSLPGDDPAEAATMIFGELPDLPHLAELPDRGPGADMIGRAATMLPDLPVQIEPSGWRFTSRPGRDLRRARDLLRQDLDALEDAGHDYAGAFKLQVAGPVTLAASIELTAGHRALSDRGALRDIAEALAGGLRDHIADVQSRLPRASIVLQLDEPSVPAALAARIPTASGYGTLPALDPIVARTTIAAVLSGLPAAARAVHCCAAGAPLRLFAEAGAEAVSVDLDQLTMAALDQVGQLIDDGVGIWLGAIDPAGDVDSAADVARRVLSWWSTLGFPAQELSRRVVLTPGCGLAGASPVRARQVYELLRETGPRLSEQ
jgi:methionine synthase II (cobalamin-independent)